MRAVVMDPQGYNVVDPVMVPSYAMMPVNTFIIKLPSGEVVLVLRVDQSRMLESVLNMPALEAAFE